MKATGIVRRIDDLGRDCESQKRKDFVPPRQFGGIKGKGNAA